LKRKFLIETKQLKYAYRKSSNQWVLNGIHLSIGTDEYILVCGASGSGKSTLCRTFNGLIPHFYGGSIRGDVHVAGISVMDQPVACLFATIGMVSQNAEAQLFNTTVEKEIAFGLESLGLPRSEIIKKIVQTAEIINIEPLLDRNPHTLSGGEQYLVLIAAVLATDPQLIILDEPYANLDPVNVQRVQAALRAVHARGKGIIVCEHRLPLVIDDAQRMVLVQNGSIVLDGPPNKVLTQNIEPFGLELPIAVRLANQLGLKNAPFNIDRFVSVLPEHRRSLNFLPNPPKKAPAKQSVVLKADNVSYNTNGSQVLKDVSLTLRKGECAALIGANGAGKTTFLKQLTGIHRPTNGKIVIKGKDTGSFKTSQLARFIGIAFQNPDNQFFKLTVEDEVKVGPQTMGCYDEAWINEITAMFHLDAYRKRAPYTLSGGEKKRVGFAAALASKPDILVLDEPTAGQDFHFRKTLGILLERLRRQGITIIIATHDLAFAEQHAHQWLLMADGQVIAKGSPWQVMAHDLAMKRANVFPTDAFKIYNSISEKN
jgi:energy-coupling factor transport system ATP-binding protein